jgi:hypothetical protein
MNLLDKIAQISSDQVKKYGAQYYTFAIFCVISYPLAYLYEINSTTLKTNFFIRMIPTILGLLILYHKKWPAKFTKYLPLVWHVSIMLLQDLCCCKIISR